MEQKPIALILVSGFLGSGKTTFMKALLQGYASQKIGVLVNEFGSVGIDGPLVGKSGITLVEINNGSVFCACLKDGFVRTLKEFSTLPIDMLIIESSGMADPASMNTVLQGLAPYVQRPYEYRGCVCLADCTTFLDYIDVLLPLRGQVATADFIIINKTDLVSQSIVKDVDDAIREINPKAPLYHTIYADVPMELLTEKLQSNGYTAESSNTCSNRALPYVLSVEGICLKPAMEAFYSAIASTVLRVKGFVRGEEGVWWHVEGVAQWFEMKPAKQDVEDLSLLDGGKLILIAAHDNDVSTVVEEAWQTHCGIEMQLQAT